MFAGSRSGLSFRMQDGQSVIALGSISVYERDGKYQLYAEEIILDGAGLLYEKFEALKRELAEMGMFAPEYKRPIPAFSRKSGIVTAPTGAAIRDIQNIAHRRNPGVQLILYPALVQGKDAAPSIIRGIETLDACGVDVIIVGRGGGSIEDLWAFNEESVAYAIFRCSTPVISAVGHETDFTIADYVADLRAPTPSAAAELAVADVSGILAQMEQYQQQLARRMTDRLLDKRTRLSEISGKLQFLSPQNQIREQRQLLIEKEEKLQYRMANVLENKRHRMLIYIERFRGLSPLDKLKQGYAYVADAQGKTVTSTKQVKPEDMLTIYVADGCIHARVADTESEGNEARQEERTDG